MTQQNPDRGRGGPSTATVVALAVVACLAIGSTALLLIAVDKSQLPEGWLALYLGFLGTTIAGFVGVARLGSTLGSIAEKQEKVAQQVDDLYNGRGDAKHRAGTADVLRDDLIDPAYLAERATGDRARRDTH